MSAAPVPIAELACTYRGCTELPVRRLQASTGQRIPWFGCAQHYPAMQEALATGLPGAQSGTAWVDVRPIREEDFT